MLISIFQRYLEGYDFHLYFFFLPIVLAAFWWGKKGVAISLLLGFFLITIDILDKAPQKDLFSDVIKSLLFFHVALLVGVISDEKNEAIKKEIKFKLDTAHYFFNPLCIAEGNLDLLMHDASGEIKERLSDVKSAVQRIKKVAVNVVELGEIHE